MLLPMRHLSVSLSVRIPYLTSTDTPKIQYPKEVEVRVKSYPKTKIKMMDAKKYKAIYLPDWLQDFRENLVDESASTEPRKKRPEQEVMSLPSHLMNCPWSREQKWNRVRVSTVYIRTFRSTQIVISG